MSEKDLKCVITITGKQGEDEANINLEFDPPIMKDGEKFWDDSGAETMVSMIFETIKEARS